MEIENVKGCWVGLDWGDREHSICILNPQNNETTCFEVKHDLKGMDTLIERLPACSEVLGIGVETHCHLVVQHLLQSGFTIYSLNPKMVKNWRASVKAQPSKNDTIDATTIAYGLSHYHDQLRPFYPADAKSRELSMLCDDEVNFIGQRTALVNQLQASLKLYYPQALDFMNDWTKPTAWKFVIKYPNPSMFQRATKKGLIGFLKAHRIGISPKWEERIEHRNHCSAWNFDEATSAAKEFLTVSLACQLIRLEATLKQYRKRINQLFNDHPDAELFLSLPGCGEKLASRLLAFFGVDRTRFDSAQGLQQLSGVVPVSKVSGGKIKKPMVVFRRAVKREFRDMMHLFAWCSLRFCAWAKAFYDRARQKGDSYALALRKLGEKWLKIIYRMWKDNQKYDEAKYLNALIAHGSPLVKYMNQAA